MKARAAFNRRQVHAAALAGLSSPGWLLASACAPRASPPGAVAWTGGWVGQDPARGHALRGAPGRAAGASAHANNQPHDVTYRVSVVVVGAGVAGLAAARALRRAGIDDVVVLELEAEAGGNARGHTMGGLPCPLGAHYLPVPDDRLPALREWLGELGLMTHAHGRWHAEQAHRCHAPQERLWVDGQWVEGLLPPADPGSERAAHYARFAEAVVTATHRASFTLPMGHGAWTRGHDALDAVTFGRWLAAQGLTDEGLLGYLDYACRDDFGAGIATVSAWAGLHYFASRHGFRAPVDARDETAFTNEASGADDDDAGVFTWPEGNARLTRALAGGLGARLHTGQLVTQVSSSRHGARVDAIDVGSGDGAANVAATPSGVPASSAHAGRGRRVRYLASQVIVAAPLHVAARIVDAPIGGVLLEAASQVVHAPWLVANLQLRSGLDDRTGAAPAWDNVLFARAGESDALGYVDATHQRLSPLRGATVLTAYWALGRDGGTGLQQQRRALLEQPWQAWSQRVVDDLARAHPDLPSRLARVDLTRYGHAMVIPRPGTRSLLERLGLHHFRRDDRVHLAHSDLAGYSVFEEAFAFGHAAGVGVASLLGRSAG